jgi:hypothetical protein
MLLAEQLSLLMTKEEPIRFNAEVPSLSDSSVSLGLDLRTFAPDQTVHDRSDENEPGYDGSVDQSISDIPEDVWANDEESDEDEPEPLPGGEPPKPSKSPRYLRECLSQLSNQEGLEPVLKALPMLIQTSSERKHLVIPVCKRLLHTRQQVSLS